MPSKPDKVVGDVAQPSSNPWWDVAGGPVVKTSSPTARGAVWIPDQRAKVPPASWQLTLHPAPIEPMGTTTRVCALQQRIPCEATKTGHSLVHKDGEQGPALLSASIFMRMLLLFSFICSHMRSLCLCPS